MPRRPWLAPSLLALALVFGAPQAPAQNAAPAAPPPFSDSPTIPATAAYRRAREVFDRMNAFDPARVRAYVESQFASELREQAGMEEHLAFFRQIHDLGGKLSVHSARSYNPPRPETAAVLVVWNAMLEAWQAVVVTVEPAAPHRILTLSLSPARTPSNLPPEKLLSDAEIARRVGAAVDRLAAKGHFSGAVLLARDGRTFLARAAGIANRDFDVPVRLDSKFNLGSMNKMFTGVAVMQLVEQGKLSLEDPVSRWLGEDWLPKSILDRVQVRHLLTHTSGLGSYFNDTYLRSSRELFRRVDDYRPLVQGDTLAFTPGTSWQYSNTGMLLAGAVIEKASGQDYFDYVREHIATPAGMTRTDCYSLDQVNPGLAVGYDRRVTDSGVVYENNLYRHVMRGGPAGGGYSTVEDLLRFDQALRAGKLLRPSSLEQLWSAHPEIGSTEHGLGFFTERTALGRRVGHSGGFSGISSQLDMYLDAGYTVVVLTNQGGASDAISALASRLLASGRTPLP